MAHSVEVDVLLRQKTGLASCDQEPIRTPSAIQPQGVLLVADQENLIVTHVSANAAELLGLPPAAAFGRSLDEVLGAKGAEAIRTALADDNLGFGNVVPVSPPVAPFPLQMVTHVSDGSVCIELEIAPSHSDQGVAVRRAVAVMRSLHAASSQRELCALVVAKLKQLTGYDRVMVYQFDREGNGEVIAEDRERGLESYLGLRYPASDIPGQARRMYLLQRVRTISDVNYVPVALLADPALGSTTPLDMTYCGLRSVSPVHLEYMRNMGTHASLGLSLIINNSLWGLLVCHHRTPLAITADLRAQCDLIGHLVSLLLGSLGDAESYAEQLRRQRTFHEVVASLSSTTQVADALTSSSTALLSLLGAGGAVIQIGERTLTLGVTPPAEAAGCLTALLNSESGGSLIAVDEVREILPGWEDHCKIASGALFLPLPPNAGNTIIWFRPEKEHVVTWAGDPRKPATSDETTGRISPRQSFAAWRELQQGHSEPWQEPDRAIALELQRTIIMAIAHQAEAELARLRYYDTLTCLPNRRLFEEHLKAQVIGANVALLYLDLDHFKAVNDTLGHATGDALLCAVAERLAGCTRETDLVVRLGGDEFVIVQSGSEQPVESFELARRVTEVLGQPFDLGGQRVTIGASVGIALGGGGVAPDTLLKNADRALYSAKAAGRGTYQLFSAQTDGQGRAER